MVHVYQLVHWDIIIHLPLIVNHVFLLYVQHVRIHQVTVAHRARMDHILPY